MIVSRRCLQARAFAVTSKTQHSFELKKIAQTAATRSLLNTAKLMEENPLLLRLKELESLERLVGLDPGWQPVRVRKTRQIENPERRFDSIETSV
jgi:hypothetical protein